MGGLQKAAFTPPDPAEVQKKQEAEKEQLRKAETV